MTTLAATTLTVALFALQAPWSSNSLMAISADGRWLLVANPDGGTVTVVDLVQWQKVREFPVGRNPQGLALHPLAPLALVCLYDEDQLVLVDWTSGQIVRRIPVPDEPYGVVVRRDGRRAYISHDFPGLISVVDLQDHRVVDRWAVGKFVRGLAIDPAGTRLYATEFYTAVLLEIDPTTGKVTQRWAGSPQYNLSRSVAIHPDGRHAYLPHTRSNTAVVKQEGSIFPVLSVVRLREQPRRRPVSLDTYNGFRAVAMPWEADVSANGRFLVIVYASSDDVHVARILNDGYYEIELVRPAFDVGRRPIAVRIHPEGTEAYVYCELDFEVVAIDLEQARVTRRLKVTERPYSVQLWRGKVLFNSARQPMAGRRWVSCAVCHPDGQPDGRTWQMPEGLRNTPALAGIRYTTPLHWSADRDEVQDFEFTIRGPLMRGRGLLRGEPHPPLGPPNAGRSADLDALAAYCNSFQFPLSPFAPNGTLTPLAQRGREIFFRPDVGCATCHSGPYYTDRQQHDVGTGADDPSEKLGPAYDTPTLLGVYRTAPYLHHGKAATLRDVITTFNRNDRHGRTSHLSEEEIEALVMFLKSLPYELPEADVAP